ncbi:hypothetical protein [Streptomyces sp. DSM 40750]|uniref:hypothetical protein n=1 Tax=Streptomyces sp. DSM 40750 TaxID=2801030 RepID=UPI00214B5A57|nr:hypothetical protein [Streptomyces sp. DSM 40750]UUU21614.1 hypothetical protein JIX55_15495 [Streptomyces sp. DSM 40750]
MRDVNGMDGTDGMDGTNSANGEANQHMTHRDITHGDTTHRDITHGDITHGDMTHSTAVERDIALLLADATGEVEIGIAPYQAVVRGGRRRKARRWTVAAAAAAVIVGATGTLTVAGVTGGDQGRVVPAATAPVTPEPRDLSQPSRTTLAEGRDQGKDWRVTIETWEAPRDEEEAAEQLAAMGLFGDEPTEGDSGAELVGKSWYFVHLTVGDEQTRSLVNGEADALSGRDLEGFATPLHTADRNEDDALERLVIGKVAPTAQQVRVTWSDGTSVDVDRDGDDVRYEDLRNPRIVEVKGAQADWFVALAPEGVGYESVEVTK